MPITRPLPATLSEGTRFRLGSKTYPLAACVCLYRYEAMGAEISEFLVLTPDMRFAHVARPQPPVLIDNFIDPRRPVSAVELESEEAREFLLTHGEEDIVDDFPDLFSIVHHAERMTKTIGTISRDAAH